MITILRRLRKSLIESGSTRKYMLYAIGEILLVIIGILLALAINDWRKASMDRQSELLTLESLKAEFEGTKKQIEKYVADNEAIINTNQKLIAYFAPGGSEFKPRVFDSLLYNALWNSSFFLNQGTLSEIIFSGRLSSISDRQLRVLLSAWGSEYEEAKLTDGEGFNYLLKKNSEYFDRKIPWMDLSNYDRFGFNIGRSYEKKFDRIQLASDLEFENIIFTHMWNTQNKNLTAQSLLELNVKILEKIENSIHAHK